MNNRIIYYDKNSKISFQSLYYIDKYITYEVSSSTCGFSGICNFCIEENKLNEYIQKIDFMLENLNGELLINDCESDAYLQCFFQDSLNFYVLGQMGGSYENNILRFKLKADQTLLYKLRINLLDY